MEISIAVNIGGTLIHMEQAAYDKLRHYLDEVKKGLAADERKDVMADIECRIAEIFEGKSSPNRPITSVEVDDVIETIGRPEVLTGNPSASADAADDRQPQAENIRARFYRNLTDRMLGGVCGGLGAYFNLPVSLFRLIFVLGTIFYGTTLLVYALLWIIVPRARLAREKLAMSGGLDRATGMRADGRGDRTDPDAAGRRGCLANAARAILIMLGVLMFIPLLIALFVLMVLAVTAVGVCQGFMAGGLTDLMFGQIIDSGWPMLYVVAAVLCAALPLIFGVYALIRLIFRFNAHLPLVGLLTLLLWLVALGTLSYGVSNGVSNMSESVRDEVRISVAVPQSGRIRVEPWDNLPDSLVERHRSYSNKVHLRMNDLSVVRTGDGRTSIAGKPRISIRHADVDSVECRLVYSSRAASADLAHSNNGRISYDIKVSDGTIYAGEAFYLDDQRWSFQRVDVEIAVPAGVRVDVADDMDVARLDRSDSEPESE